MRMMRICPFNHGDEAGMLIIMGNDLGISDNPALHDSALIAWAVGGSIPPHPPTLAGWVCRASSQRCLATSPFQVFNVEGIDKVTCVELQDTGHVDIRHEGAALPPSFIC
jgi:hypothetical protein